MNAADQIDPSPDPFGFSPAWFTIGIVDAEVLGRLREEWDRGEDHNPEHYRYGAFKRFLARSRPISAELAERLFELGLSDADCAMGGALAADVLRLPECPELVLKAALASQRKHLVRIAGRRLSAEPVAPPDRSGD